MKIFRIFAVFMFVLFPFSVQAVRKANIYDIPRALPKKELISETGNRVALSDFEGDFVIAIFWSRYCVPCVRELKKLSNFVEQTKTNGVRVIMISPKAEWISGFSEQRLFMKRFGAENLEIYVDEKEAVASSFGVFSSPISILISRDGFEIGRIRGSLDWDSSDVIDYIYKVKAENG
ncbi:MAG: TlpA family protein disulfide reductase [Alphaproteobacteria bacterium]|nr:TlpA family protein disulfide reductase [Alphaproteobacteria bacterium]